MNFDADFLDNVCAMETDLDEIDLSKAAIVFGCVCLPSVLETQSAPKSIPGVVFFKCYILPR